mgnify:CR=1 FL=1
MWAAGKWQPAVSLTPGAHSETFCPHEPHCPSVTLICCGVNNLLRPTGPIIHITTWNTHRIFGGLFDARFGNDLKTNLKGNSNNRKGFGFDTYGDGGTIRPPDDNPTQDKEINVAYKQYQLLFAK